MGAAQLLQVALHPSIHPLKLGLGLIMTFGVLDKDMTDETPKKAAERFMGKEAMAKVVPNTPPGYDWGWFSREDPRMHLQTVDQEHRNLHKVWLEDRGRRVFEPVGEIPAKVRSALEAKVRTRRDSIESYWIELMIKKGWLTYRLDGGSIVLTAYPSYPIRFERKVEIARAFGNEALADPTKFELNPSEATLVYRDGSMPLDVSLVGLIFD